MLVDVFTFHYGPIQISLIDRCIIININLHSTMVLFKSKIHINISDISVFTFHYGPIQILQVLPNSPLHTDLHSTMVLFKLRYAAYSEFKKKNLHSTMVLFKSSSVAFLSTHIFIYIPLWSYSNRAMPYLFNNLSVFTFHYGPIQISIGKTH